MAIAADSFLHCFGGVYCAKKKSGDLLYQQWYSTVREGGREGGRSPIVKQNLNFLFPHQREKVQVLKPFCPLAFCAVAVCCPPSPSPSPPRPRPRPRWTPPCCPGCLWGRCPRRTWPPGLRAWRTRRTGSTGSGTRRERCEGGEKLIMSRYLCEEGTSIVCTVCSRRKSSFFFLKQLQSGIMYPLCMYTKSLVGYTFFSRKTDEIRGSCNFFFFF